MRKAVCIIVSMVAQVILFSACPPPRPPKTGLKVAILFSPSGKGDRSYNDVALTGVNEAKKRLDFTFSETQPTRAADYEVVLRNLAEAHTNLIIGVGFLYADPIKAVAPDFSDVNFVLVDGDAGAMPNVRSLVFRPEEGCYLVGAIAARTSVSKRIGFIAGMDIPIMHKFECGYVEGAQNAYPSIDIKKRYIGSTPEAFADPAKARDIALLMYDQGVDVIFHAAGASGNGVIQAAKERRKYVIGVDTDQSWQAPEWVLTSMVKRIDLAVEQAIQDASDQKFAGGVQNLGLKEKGVDYVSDSEHQHISPDLRTFVEQMKLEIVNGKTQVCK